MKNNYSEGARNNQKLDKICVDSFFLTNQSRWQSTETDYSCGKPRHALGLNENSERRLSHGLREAADRGRTRSNGISKTVDTHQSLQSDCCQIKCDANFLFDLVSFFLSCITFSTFGFPVGLRKGQEDKEGQCKMQTSN